MREVVFRLEAERPGHLEARAVGAAFSAGVTLPIHISAPTLEELQHEAREALFIRAFVQLPMAQRRTRGEGSQTAGSAAAVGRAQ